MGGGVTVGSVGNQGGKPWDVRLRIGAAQSQRQILGWRDGASKSSGLSQVRLKNKYR